MSTLGKANPLSSVVRSKYEACVPQIVHWSKLASNTIALGQAITLLFIFDRVQLINRDIGLGQRRGRLFSSDWAISKSERFGSQD